MKKCILVINWLLWNIKRPNRTDIIKTHCINAYAGHMDNLFLYDSILEQYLKENSIEFSIMDCNYSFPQRTKFAKAKKQ